MNPLLLKFFTVSTKASISLLQYPILTKKDLLIFFYEEVKYQNHATIKRKEDSVHFSVTPFTSKFLRNRNKFNSYSQASFTISEKNNLLTISFIGIAKNLIYSSLILPTFFFIMSILAIIYKGAFLTLLLPIAFIIIMPLLLLFMETIGMQLYLSNKINRIKENLRDNRSLY